MGMCQSRPKAHCEHHGQSNSTHEHSKQAQRLATGLLCASWAWDDGDGGLSEAVGSPSSREGKLRA